MNNLIGMASEMTMGTREIANLLGKRHADITRSAERLWESGAIGGSAPLAHTPYIHEQNGQTYTEYRLNKRDSLVLVAQNCPEFTAAIVDRWQDLERQLHQPAITIPQTLPEALRLAADLAEKNLELERKVAMDAPAVEFAKQIASVEKGITLSAFAKTVGLGPTKLFAMLRERKILMSCRGERWNLTMQEFVDRGYFATRESAFDSNGEKRISFTPLITGKGQQWLVERLIREGVLRGVAA
jgi:phage antirepressor YoqD-like protein